MRKIINGKAYDTDKAISLGSRACGQCGSLDWAEEELFRKRNGELFLCGTGGAATKYSVSLGGNSYSGGSKIRPLTVQMAQAWAEKNLSAEQYEAAFGKIEEDDVKQAKTFNLRRDTIAKIERLVAEQGLPSASALIERLVNGEDDWTI